MSENVAQLAVEATHLPQGLLSFIYNVLYNPDVHQLFLTDVKSLMNSFALTEAEQEAILNSMDEGKPTTDAAQEIAALLAAELETNFVDYYEEFW